MLYIHNRDNICRKGPNMLSSDYIKVLNTFVFSEIAELCENGYEAIFQQDNTHIHMAKIVKEWFEKHTIYMLICPAMSPDLNLIERV